MDGRIIKCGLLLVILFSARLTMSQRVMENLDRGVVAVPDENGNAFISWRLLGTDPKDIAFDVYKVEGFNDWRRQADTVKINDSPVSGPTHFIDQDVTSENQVAYFVKPVLNGQEQQASEPFRFNPTKNYRSVPLHTPKGYSPNDGSVADLDGDGEYELIVHMTGRGHDNSHSGPTDEPILDAYEMDGTFMWRINLGHNIREGAHYTQFIAYDLDSDGKAEVACKTADGTVDGVGNVIGDPKANYVNDQGRILAGPEFLTVFSGETGEALETKEYIPQRHPETHSPTPDQMEELWGDGYGNRMDRFLAGVAYLDGKKPSLIMARGYYARTVVAAWNWRDSTLTNKWTFDSHDGKEKNRKYAGQGNHSLSVADVDSDGKDEIIYGAMTLDDDGTGLYSTGIGHGDALHVSDLDPDHPGLEVFHIQERFDDAGANFRDAETGEILWKKPSVKAGEDGEGPGRGNSINIDPRYPGNENWVFGANIEGLFTAKGEKITNEIPGFCNFAVWWDGDLLRELLSQNVITKWDWQTEKMDTLVYAEGSASNNWTKATPVLSGDIFGDWREEVIWRAKNNQELRIYTTSKPTDHRFYTLMHNPVYRLSIAWQNVAYNQPPHPDFYIGQEMDQPEWPDITTPDAIKKSQ